MQYMRVIGFIVIVFVWLMGFLVIAGFRDDFLSIRTKLSRLTFIQNLIRAQKTTEVRARAMTLTFDEPDFSYLREYVTDSRNQFDVQQAERYLQYYEKAAALLPGISEIHALLGFFYYQQGKVRDAVLEFTQAVRLKPNIFWYHYNLAVIQLNNKNYSEAQFYLDKALYGRREETLKFIYQSRPFQQIFWPNLNFGDYSPIEGLNQGYEQAAAWRNDLKAKTPRFVTNTIPLKIF